MYMTFITFPTRDVSSIDYTQWTNMCNETDVHQKSWIHIIPSPLDDAPVWDYCKTNRILGAKYKRLYYIPQADNNTKMKLVNEGGGNRTNCSINQDNYKMINQDNYKTTKGCENWVQCSDDKTTGHPRCNHLY